MNEQQELAELALVQNELIGLLLGLDEESLNRIPFTGSWSAGQLGEHLLKSYHLVDFAKVQAIPTTRNPTEKSQTIDGVFLDFTTKYQPPAAIVPSSEAISGARLIASLRRSILDIAAMAQGRGLAFTCKEFESIGFGDLTAQEWVHFLTAHSKRHVHQLRGILAKL
jgi:DinB superfamily